MGAPNLAGDAERDLLQEVYGGIVMPWSEDGQTWNDGPLPDIHYLCPDCHPDIYQEHYDRGVPYIIQYCNTHAPSIDGRSDIHVRQGSYLGCEESVAIDNRAFCDMIHRDHPSRKEEREVGDGERKTET